MGDASLIAGLASPGPKYELPTCFAKACVKSKYPSWGASGTESLKSGRYRCEEVRFQGRRHMREMVGHFSPGPQYDVPGSIGGSTGNFIASTQRMLDNCAQATGKRVTLSAADLGGRPVFNTTQGSHADATRRGSTVAVGDSTAYWRSATMVQPRERRQGPSPIGHPQVWFEPKGSLGQTKIQEGLKASLRETWREVPSQPFRQVGDITADPPLASVFGSGNCRTDYGRVGGMDRGWRESKIQGYTSAGAPRIGPAGLAGPLRYAFIQNMGPNSVPRGTALADFDGGRPTQYKTRRPNSPLPGAEGTITHHTHSDIPATR